MNTRTHIVKIPKRPGEFRTIYVPTPEYKAELREAVGKLERKARALDKDRVNHAFTLYRSPVTNALAHVGHAYTLSCDLSSFFDHVTPRQLQGKLSKDEMALVIEDGAARQGLPTSPAVANIAFSDCDAAILKFIRNNGKNVVYTRYADDLTFSFDEEGLEVAILTMLRQILGQSGFKLNERKTQLQKASSGRRHVTGIAVDDTGIYPTRTMKRRLRAAEHNKNLRQARGLKEWCACKVPKGPRQIGEQSIESVVDEVGVLQKAWKLPKIDMKKVPERITEKLNDRVTISADPAMYLGMSTFTSGWTSCMAQPSGQYRRGVVAWLYLKGTRVAYVAKPGDTEVRHGVAKPRMLARCLVHELRDGRKVYDRVYGNKEPEKELITALEAAGIVSVSKANSQDSSESRVLGNVEARLVKPYCDSLSCARATDSNKGGATVNVFHI